MGISQIDCQNLQCILKIAVCLSVRWIKCSANVGPFFNYTLGALLRQKEEGRWIGGFTRRKLKYAEGWGKKKYVAIKHPCNKTACNKRAGPAYFKKLIRRRTNYLVSPRYWERVREREREKRVLLVKSNLFLLFSISSLSFLISSVVDFSEREKKDVDKQRREFIYDEEERRERWRDSLAKESEPEPGEFNATQSFVSLNLRDHKSSCIAI